MIERTYKDTLLLPSTDFPMKPNPGWEAQVASAWTGLYDDMREARRGKPIRMVHDGPPYANGDIHLGHVVNKVIKDIIVRHLSMKGFDAPFVLGWDCHGLPIEHKVRSLPGEESTFREACRAYAESAAARQGEDFRRLGLLADPEPYLTSSPAYVERVLSGLSRMVSLGLVSRKLRPIAWCPHDKTALAEAELEYKDKRSHTAYVKFPVDDYFPGSRLPYSLIAWTTTPWSLPGNVALAVNPDFEYVLARSGADYVAVEASRLPITFSDADLDPPQIVATCRGYRLVGATYKLPFRDRTGEIVAAGFVADDVGTGVVHIAPGHGAEDYALAIAEDLSIECPLDDAGRFLEGTHPDLDGLIAGSDLATTAILSTLGGRLWASYGIVHSYPHCWRCGNPTLTRATEQWFVEMDKSDLRGRSLASIDAVEWEPPASRNRIRTMIEGRPDWCISRQRRWGVPIPAVRCRSCSAVFLNETTIDVCISQGSDWWMSGQPFPEIMQCSGCGKIEFDTCRDILDVWFESGSSFLAVIPDDAEEIIYCEGSDQHRGWFQSSLVLATALYNRAPFTRVITHGWVVDEAGRKFSKSKSAPAAQKIIDKFGPEVLRLFVASQDYTGDIRYSDKLIEDARAAYHKIRNAFRFILGNIGIADAQVAIELRPIDSWILGRLDNLIFEVGEAYNSHRLIRIYHLVYDFCVVALSSIYFDAIKDRLYADGIGSPSRSSAVYTLRRVYRSLCLALAPILPHTAEELWFRLGESGSVFFEPFPTGIESPQDHVWDKLLELRGEVNSRIEEMRSRKEIRQNEEVSVVLGGMPSLPAETFRELCKLSDVSHDPSAVLVVSRTNHPKCDRCLRYLPIVSAGLCARCRDVLGIVP